jgi:hypothetical protein
LEIPVVTREPALEADDARRQPGTAVESVDDVAVQQMIAGQRVGRTRIDESPDLTWLMACAELRDSLADARDRAAEKRDSAANLDAFLRGDDDQAAFELRELAKRDRRYAKLDRLAAAQDRYELLNAHDTEASNTTQAVEESS